VGRDTDAGSLAIETDDLDAFQTYFASLVIGPDAGSRYVPFAFQERDYELTWNSSLLASAATNSAVKIVKHLVMNGAEVTQAEAVAAISGGCPEIVRLFDDHFSAFSRDFGLGFNEGSAIETYISAAVANHQSELLRWLVEAKLQDNDVITHFFQRSMHPLFMSNNVEALLLFLDLGGDLAICYPPIGVIAAHGDLTMLKLFGEFGRQTGAWANDRPEISDIYSDDDYDGSDVMRSRDPTRRETRLSRAAKSGSVAIVEIVLNLFPDICPQDVFGALEAAFSAGNMDVVQFLISKIDPSLLKSHIGSILSAGADTGTTEVAELFIPFMVDLEDISTCIVAATSARNVELAKWGIAWQRERNAVFSFDHVCQCGIETYSLDIVEFLGIPNNELTLRIAENSCKIGYFEGVKYAFGFLSESERLTIVQRYLHSDGASPSRELLAFFLQSSLGWRDGLMTSIRLHESQFVGSILSALSSADSVNFLTSGGTPLGVAASQGQLGIVEQLLSVAGVDCMMPDVEGKSPFVLACQSGQTHVYERLATIGRESLEANEYEVNAGFFWASQCRDIDVTFELMPFFSRFSSLDPNFHINSTSAFVLAASSGHYSLLQLLLQYPGVDVNDHDDMGCTALIRVVESKSRECIEILLRDPRVDVNQVDHSGFSALSFAVAGASEDTVAMILGSDRCELGRYGADALGLAILVGQHAITGLLLGRPDLDVNGPLGGLVDFLTRTRCEDRRMNFLIGLPHHGDPPVHETCLLLAVERSDVGLFNQITNHPTFDPIRSHLDQALFQSLVACTLPRFPGLLGNNLALRNASGESLLAVAITAGDLHNLKLIQEHPAFDLSEQDPAQCISRMAQSGRPLVFDFLSTLRGIDLNHPLPHGVNGFPDMSFAAPRSQIRSPRYRMIGDWRSPPGRRPSEGIPPLFNLRPSDVLELSSLATPRIDLDRRGKHGETILFRLMSEERCARRLYQLACMDLNARDRHGNTAAGCAGLSGRLRTIRDPMNVRSSEFLLENENGDSPLELTRLRTKRSTGSKRRLADVPRWKQFSFSSY
jgi:ankyrin repeat protein